MISVGAIFISGQAMDSTEQMNSTELSDEEGSGKKDNFLNRYTERILERFETSPVFINILYVVIIRITVTINTPLLMRQF